MIEQRLNEALEVVKPIGWLVLGLGAGRRAWSPRSRSWRELARPRRRPAWLLLVLALPFLLGRTSVRGRPAPPARAGGGGGVGGGRRPRDQPRGLAPGPDHARGAGRLGRAPLRHQLARARAPAHEESFTIRTERRGVISVGPAMTRRGDPVGHLLPRRGLDAGARGAGPPAPGAAGVAGRRPAARPRGRLHRRRQPERPGLPRAARVRPRRRPAPHPLALLGQGDGLHGRVRAARAPVPRHPPQPRHDRGRRPARLVVGPGGLRDRDGRRGLDRRARGPRRVRRLLRLRRARLVRAPTATSPSTRSAAPTSATAASSSPAGRPACWPPTPASPSSSAAARRQFTDLLRSAAAFPPEVRRFGIVVDPEGNSRVTETGGLPVLHLAAKEDLGGLLRWSVR